MAVAKIKPLRRDRRNREPHAIQSSWSSPKSIFLHNLNAGGVGYPRCFADDRIASSPACVSVVQSKQSRSQKLRRLGVPAPVIPRALLLDRQSDLIVAVTYRIRESYRSLLQRAGGANLARGDNRVAVNIGIHITEVVHDSGHFELRGAGFGCCRRGGDCAAVTGYLRTGNGLRGARRV